MHIQLANALRRPWHKKQPAATELQGQSASKPVLSSDQPQDKHIPKTIPVADRPAFPVSALPLYFMGRSAESAIKGKKKGGKEIKYHKYGPDNTASPLATWHSLIKTKAQAYHQRNALVLKKYMDKTGEYYQDISWINHDKSVGEVPYTVFDTETTGLKSYDRIVQIAAAPVDKDHVVRHFSDYNKLINPQIEIKPGATAVHGIDDEMVKNAPILEDLLYDFCKEVLGERGLVVAYNAKFDIGMPNEELMNQFNRSTGAMLNRAIDKWNRSKSRKEHGYIRPFDPALTLDPFILIQRIHPFVSLGKKLVHHYELLMGQPLENAHNAQADVDATVNVLNYVFEYLQKHSIPREWAEFVDREFTTPENPKTGQPWTPEEKRGYIADFVRQYRDKLANRFKGLEPEPLKMVDILMLQHGGAVHHKGRPDLPKLDISLNMFGWDDTKQWDGTDVLDHEVADEIRRKQDADNRRFLLHKFREDLASPSAFELAQKMQSFLTTGDSIDQKDLQKDALKLQQEMLKKIGDNFVVEKLLFKTLPVLDEKAENYVEADALEFKQQLRQQFVEFMNAKLRNKKVTPDAQERMYEYFLPKVVEDAFQHIRQLNQELGSRYFYTYTPIDPNKPLISDDVFHVTGAPKMKLVASKTSGTAQPMKKPGMVRATNGFKPVPGPDGQPLEQGLLIKGEWVDRILDEGKTWEIRRGPCHKRGPIGLIESGTGHVVGTAEVVDSIPLTLNDMLANPEKHLIDVDALKKHGLPYGSETYAWVLKNPKRFETPVPYNHPTGAVKWVNLPTQEAPPIRPSNETDTPKFGRALSLIG